MKVISISKEKLQHLKILQLGKEICNSECKVYDFTFHGEHKVLKYLKELDGEYFSSKLYTVAMLDYYKNYFPAYLNIPDAIAAVSGETVGFTVPFVEGVNLATVLKSDAVSFEVKIYCLKKIGQILEEFKNYACHDPIKGFLLE